PTPWPRKRSNRFFRPGRCHVLFLHTWPPQYCKFESRFMRQEQDFLGIKTIPPDAYWGVHSARAVENFPITGHSVAHMPELIRAFAFVKKAAAQANLQFGAINITHATAISQACDDL